MKNTIIGLILGLIIAMWAFYIYTQKPTPQNKALTTTPTSVVISISPSIDEISPEDSIKQAFAKKYNRQVDEVHLNINKEDSTHVQGGVKFGNEIAGGWFLAFKKSPGNWIVVQDGNGVIMCEIVAPYNFPPSMVPECVDKNGKLVKY